MACEKQRKAEFFEQANESLKAETFLLTITRCSSAGLNVLHSIHFAVSGNIYKSCNNRSGVSLFSVK